MSLLLTDLFPNHYNALKLRSEQSLTVNYQLLE